MRPQAAAQRLRCDTGDEQSFPAASLAREHRQRRARHPKQCGEVTNERRVCRALDGWRRDADAQELTLDAIDGRNT